MMLDYGMNPLPVDGVSRRGLSKPRLAQENPHELAHFWQIVT